VRRAVIIVAVVVAVTAAVLFVARRRSDERRGAATRLNLVLITVDTLRADRLGRGLTPNIDAVARGGTRFENARTTAPLTLPAHVTMMTGMTPPQHGVRLNGVVFKPHTPTLARVLRDEGYRTAAFVGAYVLDRRFGLAEGFEVYDDRVPRSPDLGAQLEAERPGVAVADAAITWLGTVQEPFFAWLHFYDPHAPYAPPAEFLAKAGGNAYHGEVAYADTQIGRVLDALRHRGFAERSIVAIAGDHGEALGEHGEQTHGMLAYDSTLRVPLVLAAPGTSPASVQHPVSLVDLAGTLLRAAGISAPDAMSSGSLLSRSEERDIYAESEYPRSAGWHPVAALADERWKLILSSEAELYDLQSDPQEIWNMAATMPSVAEAMSKRIGELSRPARPAASTIPPDAAERLRALGYVSGEPGSRTLDANAPNPARVVASWNAFETALSRLNAGGVENARAAAEALRTLSARHRESLVFHSTLARAVQQTSSNPSAALPIYRDALKRWPDDAALYHDLAVAARAAGEREEAMRAEQAALALDPEYPAALNGLGLLHVDAGRALDAATTFERAAKADPSNASYWTNLGNARRELGDVVGADAAYRRALDAEPKYADALNGIGVLLVQQRRPADAVSWFERALQHAPDLHEARLNLGIAYQESGQREKAAAVYRELLTRTPPQFERERQAAAELLRAVK